MCELNYPITYNTHTHEKLMKPNFNFMCMILCTYQKKYYSSNFPNTIKFPSCAKHIQCKNISETKCGVDICDSPNTTLNYTLVGYKHKQANNIYGI